MLVTGDLSDPFVEVQGALRGGELRQLKDIEAAYLATYDEGKLEGDLEVKLGDRGTLTLYGTGQLDRALPDLASMLKAADYNLEVEATGLDMAMAGSDITSRIGLSLSERERSSRHFPRVTNSSLRERTSVSSG